MDEKKEPKKRGRKPGSGIYTQEVRVFVTVEQKEWLNAQGLNLAETIRRLVDGVRLKQG